MGWLTIPVAIAGFVLFVKLFGKSEEQLRAEEAERERKEREEIERIQREEKLIASIMFVTKHESDREYSILEQKTWLRTTCDFQEDAERTLMLMAAEAGANALTRLRYNSKSEKYEAGVSRNGNPYFDVRKWTDWEALAVVAERKGGEIRCGPEKTLHEQFHLAAVDGSNIMFIDGDNADLTFVEKVVERLENDGVEAQIFFDANIGFKLFDRHTSSLELAGLLGVLPDRITIVPSGRPADPFILDFARAKGAVIVSNDRFRDNSQKLKGLKTLSVALVGNEVFLN